MLEIVHDVAPGAALAFATASFGTASFAGNIRALRDAGARVIVDDITILTEPMFQDGPIAQAVDDVVASGVAYFSSAGNQARQGYDSAFVPGTVYTAFDPRFTAGARGRLPRRHRPQLRRYAVSDCQGPRRDQLHHGAPVGLAVLLGQWSSRYCSGSGRVHPRSDR